MSPLFIQNRRKIHIWEKHIKNYFTNENITQEKHRISKICFWFLSIEWPTTQSTLILSTESVNNFWFHFRRTVFCLKGEKTWTEFHVYSKVIILWERPLDFLTQHMIYIWFSKRKNILFISTISQTNGSLESNDIESDIEINSLFTYFQHKYHSIISFDIQGSGIQKDFQMISRFKCFAIQLIVRLNLKSKFMFKKTETYVTQSYVDLSINLTKDLCLKWV